MDLEYLFYLYLTLLPVLLCHFNLVSAENVPSICNHCKTPTKGIVAERCKSEKRLSGCCCVDGKNRTVGMDMRNCSITNVQEFKFSEMEHLAILLLDHNPFTEGPWQKQFKGLTVLNYLSMPVEFQCPGGSESWKNISSQGSTIYCRKQINNCVNVTCPTQTSICKPDGPGYSKCICENGWTGYKCLRKDEKFPLLIVLSSLGASAVILGGIICCINRKGRKNAMKYRYQAWVPDEQEDLIHS